MHASGFLICLYLVLINWRILPPPAFFGMQGYPQDGSGLLLGFFAVLTLLEYPYFFWVANVHVTRGQSAALDDARRKQSALMIRLAGAGGTLMMAFFAYTILLGIGQSANGFDWQRRWPADGSTPARFYQ
jgi:hypothetical protein